MAKSYPNIPINAATWTDLVAVTPALANQGLTVQNAGGYATRVFFGGVAAPGPGDGVTLNPGDSVNGTSDHIWAIGNGSVAILVND